MNKAGPIVILEDDSDDIELYQTLFNELKVENEIVVFHDPEMMIEHLRQPDVKPFLIISDVNMPKTDGFQVRKDIDDDHEIRQKCIPYLFITTDASQRAVERAYHLSVQGIFQKPSSLGDWSKMLADIINYWRSCMSPNRF